jgi:hypothetical protein
MQSNTGALLGMGYCFASMTRSNVFPSIDTPCVVLPSTIVLRSSKQTLLGPNLLTKLVAKLISPSKIKFFRLHFLLPITYGLNSSSVSNTSLFLSKSCIVHYNHYRCYAITQSQKNKFSLEKIFRIVNLVLDIINDSKLHLNNLCNIHTMDGLYDK